MADKHILSLEIPTVSNCNLLCIKDTSQYSSELAVDCEELLITLPGFTAPMLLKVTKEFDMCLTACTLAIQKINCGTIQQEIPDGIYIIRYSVSPNDLVYVEYNHLRITSALNKYNGLLCDLDVAACDPPVEVKDKLNSLRMIKMYLDAAKAKVEFCHEPTKGMQLYNYAVKLLDKMDCYSCR